MNKSQLEALYSLSLAVRRLFHKLGHGVAALHQDTEVSIGMRAVLEGIIDGGPQTVPQLARVRPVTRQHIQGLVNALLEGGYVEYVPNPAHKRSRLVRATDLGVRTFEAMRRRENEAFRQLRLDLAPEDLRSSERVLRKLIGALEGEEWQHIVSVRNSKSREKSDDA